MFNKAALLLCLLLCACDLLKKDEETPPVQLAFIPSQCTFVQTVNLPNVAWGPVDEYSCAMYDKMTCKAYAQGDHHLGIECVGNNPATPQGPPSNCTHAAGTGYSAGGTIHGYLDGIVLFSRHYDCGQLNGNLMCDYYNHPGDACNDTNGSALDDCDPNEDDVYHEELRCVLFN
jgi:hypothetical protein